ncbi:hypothetical protein KWE42_03965 [Acinetobacter pittii]|uniref:Uncharacterized protein n=1 Tax=Acinetobacter pittii TaxID=48296 RepID=A0AAE9M7C6_ACIPI|nr:MULTISPECIES: hypothetical protein [Acinetobacter]AVZ85467.1 hypothetical protein CDG55_06710 [Acinetobacter sp. WCHA45]USU93555.1 hypothetical protein MWH18_14505 [Acinetobacter pittii]
MSKGKKGEMRFTITVAEIALKERRLDFTRFTTTNTADGGGDLYLYAPSNLGEKFEDVRDNGTSNICCSSSMIEIRVDVKNKKADKDDAEKFLDDIKKNPKSGEHWLVYKTISKPAGDVILEAQESSKKPIRTFSFEDLKKISQSYASLPEYDEDE